MKLLTFAVPCYNSAGYMARCLDSLLTGGSDVEIVIVNDGSTDGTGSIADEYQARYPDIIRAVHQQNRGHGGAVNAGLARAAGRYFKVVDSDDWLDVSSLRRVLETLRGWEAEGTNADLMVCNYVYDRLEEGKRRTIRYRNVFRSGAFCGWERAGRFLPAQYLLMHSMIYRTGLLRDMGLQLPEHTFYVDNILAFQPLPRVEKVFYLDADLYHYLIGRPDQSISEKVMMSRVDQQIRVISILVESAALSQAPSASLRKYMVRYLSMLISNAVVHLLLTGTDDARRKRGELWRHVRAADPVLYRKLRGLTMSGLTCLPGRAGDRIVLFGYRAVQKAFKVG